MWRSAVEELSTWPAALAEGLGIPLGPAILLVALSARLLLVPGTVPLTRWSRAWQAAYRRLKPEIRAVRQRHRDDPRRSMKEVDALYAEAGIRVVDWAGLLSASIQLPVLVGLFQAVLLGSEGTPLARGSWVLGLLAGFVFALSVAVTEPVPHIALVALSGVLPLAFVLWLGAGVGWYLLGLSLAVGVQAILVGRADRPDQDVASR